MRCLKMLLIIITMLGIAACNSDDEEILNNSLMEFVVDDSFQTASTDNWVIITDRRGAVLDFSAFETGDEFSVTGPVQSDRVNITYVSASASSVFIETYTDIETNQRLLIDAFIFSAMDEQKNITLEILRLPMDFDTYVISDKIAKTPWSGFLTDSSTEPDKFEGEFVVTINENPSDLLLSFYNSSGRHQYVQIQEVVTGELYEVDVTAEARNFDNYMKIATDPLNTYFLTITGFGEVDKLFSNSLPGTHFVETRDISGFNSIEAGYNSGYQNYQTSFFSIDNESTKQYLKVGSIADLENFEFPASDFTIINDDLNSFSFESSYDFSYQTSIFINVDETGRTNINWNLNTPVPYSENVILVDFPTEISDKYPAIQESDYILFTSNFKNTFGSFSYDELIEFTLKEPITLRTNREEVGVQKNFLFGSGRTKTSASEERQSVHQQLKEYF